MDSSFYVGQRVTTKLNLITGKGSEYAYVIYVGEKSVSVSGTRGGPSTHKLYCPKSGFLLADLVDGKPSLMGKKGTIDKIVGV